MCFTPVYVIVMFRSHTLYNCSFYVLRGTLILLYTKLLIYLFSLKFGKKNLSLYTYLILHRDITV